MLNSTELEAIKMIRNTIVHKGYFPSMRELSKMLGYKSPRSASVITEGLIQKGMLKKKGNGKLILAELEASEETNAQTIDIPLLGSVACGLPILAEENVTAMIPVSVQIAKPSNRYFFLRAKGDSMNEAGIDDGDLVLIKQQNSANNGDLVVALIDENATIKELQIQNDCIILKPRSTNKNHQPIILTRDFQVQGVVAQVIKDNGKNSN